MNAHNHHAEEAIALRSTRQQIADLLHRYPEVSDSESREILTFLRTGRHLDVGMQTADERVKPQLDSFMADHKRHFRLGAVESVAVVSAIVGLLAICWLIWEAIGPGAA